MTKCEFNRCSNHNYDYESRCLLYNDISKCSYQKDFECPVIKDNKKRIKDYEAYDTMHSDDGIVGVSVSARRL